MKTLLLLFKSTRAVIRAEKLFRQHHIPCRVIPVPREISSECGMSLQIRKEYESEALSILGDAGLQVKVHNR